jgi:hypothetical protein
MKTNLYRWYCGLDSRDGRVDIEAYRKVLSGILDGWTEVSTRGVWGAVPEDSVIFEYVNLSHGVPLDAEGIADRLRVAGKQDAVLFTIGTVHAGLMV